MKHLRKFNESEEIDNFTSQYYDNFDDDEDKDQKYKIDLQNFEENNLSKIKLYEDWKKNLVVGALMTASTFGGMNKTYANQQDPVNISTEISQNMTTKIKTPTDLINFVKDSKERNFTRQQLENILDLQSKKHFISLINSDAEWKNAFDKALEFADNLMRQGTEYILYLKSDKAKKIDQPNTPITFEDKKKMEDDFQKKGLNPYKDYVFQVLQDTKGKDWKKMLDVYETLDYINWRFI
jgi:hypothetical protein